MESSILQMSWEEFFTVKYFNAKSHIYKLRYLQPEKVLSFTNTGWQECSAFVLLEMNFAPSTGKTWKRDLDKVKFSPHCPSAELLYAD